MCDVRIGTSGWHYKHWRGPFYPPALPPGEMLAYYVQQFDSVEINSSFYRLPIESAVQDWRDTAPAGFVFAAKGSRFLTHMKKLKDPEPGLEKYFGSVRPLGRKLGPIVFQLPPRWGLNLERLSGFLAALPRRRRYAFEFRDPSWHTSSVYELLRRHNAAFCMFDLAGWESPREITADFTYARLHGPGGPYQGSYDRRTLSGWVRRIDEWGKKLKAVYFYFDNDQNGHAVQNALKLKAMVEGR